MTFRERVLARELVTGTWLNLGSSVTAEMAAVLGYDWALIDKEHGVGDQMELLHQLQAMGGRGTIPIVRIPHKNEALIKLALDMGARGIMVPYVESAEDAEDIVRWSKYFPDGTRGAAKGVRASAYGTQFEKYFPSSTDELLTIVQIESSAGVENAEAIASVPGVDVLFVGPFDLSINLGVREQFRHPDFLAATDKVIAAAKKAGKAAGILVLSDALIEPAIKQGYTFVASGSDGGHVFSGMSRMVELLSSFKHR